MSRELDIDVSFYGLGEGAFRPEGVPVKLRFKPLDSGAENVAEFIICELDQVLINRFLSEGIDLGKLTKQEDESPQGWISRVEKQACRVFDALVKSWAGLRRSDGSQVECNPDTRRGLALDPIMLSAVIRAGRQVSRVMEKNSGPSSGGSVTPRTAPPSGESTSGTVGVTASNLESFPSASRSQSDGTESSSESSKSSGDTEN